MNEYKFTCKRCNNIWYVNKERLDSLINKDKWDRKLAIANSIFGMFGNSRSQDAANHFTREREINELAGADLVRCPNCRSENFVYEEAPNVGAGQIENPYEIPSHLRDQIRELMKSNKKIEAIQLYRAHTNAGLREVKDAVEAFERNSKTK